jgi:hypothetical protein
MSTAVGYLEDRGFGDVAHLLTRGNPKAMLDDDDLTSVPSTVVREGVWSRFKNIIKT